ncbi:MAG: serine/threonine protein kinase [Deltaproteobacteria bacterium]|nr:serine/threonine protein kinase [Deltaproteobacteria bacterium]
MGAVYEAENLGIGKRVAVKFVDPEFATDEKVVARFAREARAMSAIESAHIVSIFDAGTEDGRPYLVMELLRGEDLGERLRRLGRVPLKEAMHIIAQVLKGLARAHAAGIVHRDLKPDNVFLVKHDTDPLFAKIVDFGISKIDRPKASTHPLALTGRGTVLGTPFYMSPEQAQASSDVDGRTDLYSAGAILFECLTGRPPHTGESYEQVILSICMTDAPTVRSYDPSVPPDVSSFVARSLARDRGARFKNAERMLAALHAVAPEERVRVPLDSPSTETLESAVEMGKTVLDGGAGLARASTPLPPSPRDIGNATRLGVGSLDGMATHLELSGAPAPPRPVEVVVSSVPPTAPSPGNERAVPSSAAPPPPRVTPEPPPRPKKPIGMALATAAVATLMGLGVTFGVISLLDKKQGNEVPPVPARTTSSSTTTSGSATAATTTAPSSSPSEVPSAPGSGPSSTPSAAPPVSAVAPTTKSSAGAVPRPSGGAGKLPSLPVGSGPTTRPTKPLDINRDLP